MDMLHEAEPAKVLLDRLAGWQDKIKLAGTNVLVAIYVRPQQTASRIHLPDSVRDEDKYQGKVGLVVAMGPLAFIPDEKRGISFPQEAAIGDWVIVRGADSWQLKVNGVDCRMMSDVAIRGTTPDPDKVY